jgi:urea ABC transporter urea binding protein
MAVSELPLVPASKLAVDEINDAGGLLGTTLRLVVEDGRSEPSVFAERATKLVEDDGAVALFGCWTSSSRKAVRSVVEERDSLLWYPLQYEGLEQSPHIVYTGSCLNQQIEPAALWALEQGWKRCVLVGSDYVFPRTANHLIKALVESHGGEVLDVVYRPLGSTDFSGAVQAINDYRPEVVFNTINGESNVAFFHAYAGVGLTAAEVPVMSFSVSELEVDAIHHGMAGHYACWSYFGTLASPENRLFSAKYRARTARPCSDPAVAAYTQVHLWASAVMAAGAFDAASVRKHLVGQEFLGPAGRMVIQENQHLKKRAFVGQARGDGQFDIVWESDGMIAPKPWLGLEDIELPTSNLLLKTLAKYPDVVHLNTQLDEEIARRLSAEEQLRFHQTELEALVAERTEALRKEIVERERAEKERFEMERRVLHGQKLESLGLLAGGVAHDFNNILTAILGYVSITALDETLSPTARQNLSEIETAARRAADLANQMLAYSGRGRLVVSLVDLNDLAEGMLHLLDATLLKKPVLEVDLEADLPLIQADVTQVRQVVLNFLTNASEAIGDNTGVIGLSTGVRTCAPAQLKGVVFGKDVPAGEFVFVRVSDDGCGMDAATQATMFEPFVTSKFTGRGLGMSAVQGIMLGHKGAMTVSSELGKGTIIEALFPATDSKRAPVVQSTRADGEVAVVGGGKILVVDDEEAVRNVVSRMLRLNGYEVLLAQGGSQAVEVLAAAPEEVSCVLLDLTMPRMGGLECMRHLRRIRGDIPIVICSGYSAMEVRDRFGEDRDLAFLHKPFDSATLMAKLEEMQQPRDRSPSD